jgi:hypothetical protein
MTIATAKRRKPIPDHGSYARAAGRPATGIAPCDCGDCKRAVARYAKQRKYRIACGQPLKVPSGRARDHLDMLRGRGVTWVQLTHDTGLKVDTMLAIARGERSTIWRTTAQRILAVNPVPSPDALVPSLGSTRRLRALIADGHRQRELVPYGLSADTLATLVNNPGSHVRYITAETITRAYTEIAATPGTYGRNRARGTALGWRTPGQWHPDDLDTPEPEPEPTLIDHIAVERVTCGQKLALSTAEKHEATRQMTEAGRTATEIADLIGVTKRTVVRWRTANGWTVSE